MNLSAEVTSPYRSCTLCPHRCGTDRLSGHTGRCRVPADIYLARAALHYWEEPCISGECGSGTVFFSGCNLGCVFCQNYSIAKADVGQKVSVERLSEIFLELKAKGAANINLVTPTHYVPSIVEALRLAKAQGLTIPIVYNTGGYETVETLRLLDGLVDIYLPDFKYLDPALSARYSHAADYPEVAKAALAEMYRQVGNPELSADMSCHTDDEPVPLMKKGIIVRHLALPGCEDDSRAVLRYLYETYGDRIYISIMNQYTPLPHVAAYPELNRRITEDEYDRLTDYAVDLGIENGFIQEGETAEESFIPEFDYEGV
ncbi:MAG: radical SAM protein [Lachnospiraceae bacterium]|nr:radical SAM protein [Lachnospiraceae bacterium]